MNTMFLKKLNICSITNHQFLKNALRLSSTASPNNAIEKVDTPDVPKEAKKEVSKAMRAYLQRAQEHNEFMKHQNHEYQIGKRHLANMMGENPDTFTQEDIDRSIEYLFPSGLFDKRARPLMRPPAEVFPQRKAAEFDETGRPNHFLFYTMKANFYKLLYDIVEHMNEMNKFEDAMIRKKTVPDPNLAIELSGYQWIDKVTLEKILVENLSDREYDNFIVSMERLISLPYSYRLKEFILTYRKPLMTQTKTYDIPKLQYGADGRGYITTYECLRKRARGDVTLRTPGKGLVTINGEDITYFKDLQCREQPNFTKIYRQYIYPLLSGLENIYTTQQFNNLLYPIKQR